MDLGLRDKVAIVTGGARGLGQAICRILAAEGAHVAVNYRSNALRAAELVEQLRQANAVNAVSVRGDVSKELDVRELFDTVEQQMSAVDILINNAGICPTCKVHDMSLEQWEETVRTNLTGTFLTSREFVQRLLGAKRHGRIVNISSTAAFLGSTTGHAPYDASKGGIVSFTSSLAREVAEHGITVNAVAPGMIRTDMTAATLDVNQEKYRARIPVRRVAVPREIADVVVFLASDRASYMTGTTVNVSGGLLMR